MLGRILEYRAGERAGSETVGGTLAKAERGDAAAGAEGRIGGYEARALAERRAAVERDDLVGELARLPVSAMGVWFLDPETERGEVLRELARVHEQRGTKAPRWLVVALRSRGARRSDSHPIAVSPGAAGLDPGRPTGTISSSTPPRRAAHARRRAPRRARTQPELT